MKVDVNSDELTKLSLKLALQELGQNQFSYDEMELGKRVHLKCSTCNWFSITSKCGLYGARTSQQVMGCKRWKERK